MTERCECHRSRGIFGLVSDAVMCWKYRWREVDREENLVAFLFEARRASLFIYVKIAVTAQDRIPSDVR